MADNDNGEEPTVNLEMPSLGFGSKRKKRKEQEAEPVEEGADETPAAEAEAPPYVPPTEEPPVEPAAEEPTRPLYVDDVPEAEGPPAEPSAPEPTDEAGPATTSADTVAPEPRRRAEKPARPSRVSREERPPREPRPPLVTGLPAAAVTGAVVGLISVGLTYLGLKGCDAVQGTESCGGPGFFILVAIMVLMVVTGGALLKMFQVVDPGSTSFLAVGLAIVITLLFLIDQIFEWWMVIVIPVVFIATYALSHWVTVRFIEPAEH